MMFSLDTCEQDFAGPGRQVQGFRDSGCHVKFDNGWTVSIQWGAYSYCANRKLLEIGPRSLAGVAPDCANAEVAAWKDDGAFLHLDGDDVGGMAADLRRARCVGGGRTG